MIFEEKDKIVNSSSMNSSTLNNAISFVKHHLNLKQSREAHVGRNPSNLTTKLTLGLTLQVFETS
jgi:hypothetical protein